MKKILLTLISIIFLGFSSFAKDTLAVNNNNVKYSTDTERAKIDISVGENHDNKDFWDKLREWGIALTTIGTIVTVGFGAWRTLKELRLKAEAVKVETDIKLIKHFTEVMDIANGRSGYQVSEMAIEKLFDEKVISDADKQNAGDVKKKIDEVAIITLPVGRAAQYSAIASITTLAKEHKILRAPGQGALEEIVKIPGIDTALVQRYLDELKEKK